MGKQYFLFMWELKKLMIESWDKLNRKYVWSHLGLWGLKINFLTLTSNTQWKIFLWVRLAVFVVFFIIILKLYVLNCGCLLFFFLILILDCACVLNLWYFVCVCVIWIIGILYVCQLDTFCVFWILGILCEFIKSLPLLCTHPCVLPVCIYLESTVFVKYTRLY